LNILKLLNIYKLPIDLSSLESNIWLAGFTKADKHFNVVIREFKPKSETIKRSQSKSVRCKFYIT